MIYPSVCKDDRMHLPCLHNWLSLPVSVSPSPHPSPVSETEQKDTLCCLKTDIIIYIFHCEIFTAYVHFYCVLDRLSSRDHLDVEKSPCIRGMAAGSRYIGRSDSLQSFWIQICSKVRPSISPPLCIHLPRSRGLGATLPNLSLRKYLIPDSFFFFTSFSFHTGCWH